MKFDLTKLCMLFDELITPPTNQELGIYWFRAARQDGLIVTFSFSAYEATAGVLISNISDVAISSINMKNCSEIRVLDEEKKHLEIVHSSTGGRCFLSLTGDDLVSYTE